MEEFYDGVAQANDFWARWFGDGEWELPEVLYSIDPWKDGQKAPLPKVQSKTLVIRDL